MRKNKGFTLIEIIVTLVILAIGITSVMAVFTTTRQRAFYPDVQWVAVKIADVILQDFMQTPLQVFPCLKNASQQSDLCNFQDTTQVSFNHFFVTTPDSFKPFKISVKLKALPEESVLISLRVFHPALGNMDFDAIKAINNA